MFKALNRFALERPVIFWSCAIGAVGPVMVWTVPSIRRNYFGFKGYEPLPITYPLPNRPRQPTTGYEDSA
ncbi:hypothetical protein G6F57_005495 [Rhizopus arrhizus]|uniref:NADH-ubiquinone oxidoreductase 9.5 kDa subunit n=3 Tax=Rhizopus TaxID=4842 RepID=I1CMK7_RHIO9|nr:hypothetical protein RO3G_14398 [Rhizopus delemar RA 99-880]KAG0747116.1 hypothetical protein G6F23_003018 [Rhizopus arrhizus]KAG1054505.1 hypothetical protein G6F43_003490 [Rhizopus delemar]KAG0763940.1 hypothetical protein G6F24_005613 [Rhizopus arrhizus]KAG0771613.1 hypothetical protein G6F22_016331 [Rhizopus arrhizus]|eukprot:EIE89687.1 hypothetical protein RO3G_14398 [Rhizopus delemar RA 99-880]